MIGRSDLSSFAVRLGVYRAAAAVAPFVLVFGEAEDLYDFSYAAARPAPHAATLQLGGGTPPPTKIYRDQFAFRFTRALTSTTLAGWASP